MRKKEGKLLEKVLTFLTIFMFGYCVYFLYGAEILGNLKVKGKSQTTKSFYAGCDSAKSETTYFYTSNDANKPNIRWAGAYSKWQYSNDGTTWIDFGAGGEGHTQNTDTGTTSPTFNIGSITAPDTTIYIKFGNETNVDTLVVCGIRYSSNDFQRNFGLDETWSMIGTTSDTYTKLLLHCDGANGETAFSDSELPTPKTVTAYNNVTTSTGAYKFGNASALFASTGVDTGYLTVGDSNDWDFNAGKFTIDLWIRWDAIVDENPIINQGTYELGTYWSFDVLYGNIAFSSGTYLTAGPYVFCAFSPSVNTWYHLAVVRNGTTANDWYLFINGVSQSLGNLGSWSDAIPSTPDGALLYIGHDLLGLPYKWFRGRIDEPRVSKGIARWTTNFTPPVRAYPY